MENNQIIMEEKLGLSGARVPVPDPTQRLNRIQDAVISFMNPDTIHFFNKTYFKYSFVNTIDIVPLGYESK